MSSIRAQKKERIEWVGVSRKKNKRLKLGHTLEEQGRYGHVRRERGKEKLPEDEPCIWD